MKKVTVISIATLVIVFALYEMTIRATDLAEINYAANQWADNTIKAQNYIYGNHDADIVVTGSSLANMLKKEWIASRSFNLAMAGQSSQDGLDIINRSGAKPKIVLVETNHIEKSSDKDFQKNLFNPALYQLRKYSYTFRERYKPSTIISYLIFSGYSKYFAAINNSLRSDLSKPMKGESRLKALIDESLARAIKSHAVIPAREIFDGRIRELKKVIDQLSIKGVTVVFFEMPTHPAICNSERLKYNREAIKRYFPKRLYLHDTNCQIYTTSDGHHLTTKSAHLAALRLKKALADYIRRKSGV